MQSLRTDEMLNEPADLYLTGPVHTGVESPGQRGVDGRRRRSRPDVASPLRVRVVNPPRRRGPATDTSRRDVLGWVDRGVAIDEYGLENQLAEQFDGPVPLQARCPHQPCIRLLVDRAGRIHIWRGQLDNDAHAGIVSLIEARFWVHENIELIALAQQACKFDLTAEPMLHLFTPNTTTAAALEDKLGPYLKLHVVRESVCRPRGEQFDSAADEANEQDSPSLKIVG